MLPNDSFIVWIATTYVCVFVAMVIDFVSGVRKARQAGIATRSRGYKMSCDKAVKYFLPMLCLSCVDLLASVFFIVPFLTMAMGAFNIFCELMSVLETTREKAEIKRTAQSIRMVIDNDDPLVKSLIRFLVNEMENHCDGKEEKNEKD